MNSSLTGSSLSFFGAYHWIIFKLTFSFVVLNVAIFLELTTSHSDSFSASLDSIIVTPSLCGVFSSVRPENRNVSLLRMCVPAPFHLVSHVSQNCYFIVSFLLVFHFFYYHCSPTYFIHCSNILGGNSKNFPGWKEARQWSRLLTPHCIILFSTWRA